MTLLLNYKFGVSLLSNVEKYSQKKRLYFLFLFFYVLICTLMLRFGEMYWQNITPSKSYCNIEYIKAIHPIAVIFIFCNFCIWSWRKCWLNHLLPEVWITIHFRCLQVSGYSTFLNNPTSIIQVSGVWLKPKGME